MQVRACCLWPCRGLAQQQVQRRRRTLKLHRRELTVPVELFQHTGLRNQFDSAALRLVAGRQQRMTEAIHQCCDEFESVSQSRSAILTNSREHVVAGYPQVLAHLPEQLLAQLDDQCVVDIG